MQVLPRKRALTLFYVTYCPLNGYNLYSLKNIYDDFSVKYARLTGIYNGIVVIFYYMIYSNYLEVFEDRKGEISYTGDIHFISLMQKDATGGVIIVI